MPKLIPTEKFIEDAERFRRQPEIMKKIAKTLGLLEKNPLHPGLHFIPSSISSQNSGKSGHNSSKVVPARENSEMVPEGGLEPPRC